MTEAHSHGHDHTEPPPAVALRVKALESLLVEKGLVTSDAIDELVRIAAEHDTTPAAIALAWVQARPGVDSTIIGARTMKQLENNLVGNEIVALAGWRAFLV